MTDTLFDLTGQLIAAAKKAGADAADAIAVQSAALSADVLNGVLEHVERSEALDIGLRVFVGQRQANISAGKGDAATLEDMAARAVAMAREAPQDAAVGLADPEQLTSDTDATALELADPGAAPDAATLETDARRAEAAAAMIDGVSQVQSASAGYSRSDIALAATNGFAARYARTNRSVSAVAITGEGTGMERDYAGESRVFAADLPSPEQVGTQAGERTIARAGARKPPTGPAPVLFDERISGTLIGHLLAAVDGAAVVRGGTWARDALDQPVLPDALTLTETPHRPRIAQSRLFDAEGLATADRKIIDAGILTGWTLDLSTGHKLGMPSTANASRGTGGAPFPMVGNLTLTPGDATRADLIRDMGTGLLVTSLIGASINPTTGDYSRGASGFWVEGGQIQYPVNECTIAGNLRDMLRSLIAADDGRPELSRVIPSLLVAGLTIAGA
ncbi:MAG: TldD/PmbA family protein [Rhodobacteraceae bacterium]|nr:TldD/PmbA family protein [Paracoccaceae bacterium]